MSFNLVLPLAAGVIAFLLSQIILNNRAGSEKTVTTTLPLINTPAGTWNFVALQYCYGISNRSYIVFITNNMICGAKVRGPLAAPGVVTDRWQDPYFYPRPDAVIKYTGIALEAPRFKEMDTANFQLTLEDVDTVQYDSGRKWGMGTVPYSGRIILTLKNGKKMELILLGKQDGIAIRDRLVSDGFGKAEMQT